MNKIYKNLKLFAVTSVILYGMHLCACIYSPKFWGRKVSVTWSENVLCEKLCFAMTCSTQTIFYSVMQTFHVKLLGFHKTMNTVKLFPRNFSHTQYFKNQIVCFYGTASFTACKWSYCNVVDAYSSENIPLFKLLKCFNYTIVSNKVAC